MKKIILLTLTFWFTAIYSQDLQMIKMYNFDKTLLNTAWAFSYQAPAIDLINHHQWEKPISQNDYVLNTIIPTGTNMGLQTSLTHSRFLYKQATNLFLGYYYSVRLNNFGTILSFSLTPVFSYYSVNSKWFNPANVNDPVIATIGGNSLLFTTNAGIHLKHNNFDFGLSGFYLIPAKYSISETYQIKLNSEFNIYSAYKFSNANETFEYQPFILLNFRNHFPFVGYFNNQFIIKKFLAFGIGYYETFKIDRYAVRSLLFSFKIILKKRFYFGFNYENHLTAVSTVFGNAYGIVLGYSFTKKKNTIPSYF